MLPVGVVWDVRASVFSGVDGDRILARHSGHFPGLCTPYRTVPVPPRTIERSARSAALPKPSVHPLSAAELVRLGYLLYG